MLREPAISSSFFNDFVNKIQFVAANAVGRQDIDDMSQGTQYVSYVAQKSVVDAGSTPSAEWLPLL